MPNFIDLSGKRLGLLTVQERVKVKKGKTHWRCLCDCGNQVTMQYSNLQRPGVGCGCQRTPPSDLLGQRRGSLLVVERLANNGGHVQWKCICDCGKITVRESGSLNKETSEKSCGCLQRNDLTGQKFGRLLVIEKTEVAEYGATRWKCFCDCGNTATADTADLVRGRRISCGCATTIDLLGQRFGRLVVIQNIGTNASGRIMWLCQCDCGWIQPTSSQCLRRGATKSCGCFLSDSSKERKTTHGYTKDGKRSTTYSKWAGMISRCNSPNNERYSDYGGRGISVAPHWLKFENFLADLGECPPGLTLERNDVNGNYCPENTRWATWKEQARNKTTTRFITYKGETRSLGEWVELSGIGYGTLYRRLELGWSVEDVMTRPIRQSKMV